MVTQPKCNPGFTFDIMIDLIVLPWGHRHHRLDLEVGLPRVNQDMIEVTVKDQESNSQSPSVSDGTVESTSSDLTTKGIIIDLYEWLSR